MTNELKSLTWKYFWQQKWKETKTPIKCFSVLGIYIFLVLGFINDYDWAKIIGICLLIPWIIKLAIMMVRWIESN